MYDRCPICHPRKASRGGTTTERGYGWSYQQARAKLLATATECWICGQPPTATTR
jgi:hypothetical protein